MNKKLESHPYADLFPMMTAAELDALAEDVGANGLQQPIVLYQGQVLDGRNRLLACERAGVEPTFVTHEGDDASALAFVESTNVRRDLTSAQRAIVAARRWRLNGDTKDRGRGRRVQNDSQTAIHSVKQLASKYRVSDNTIAQARDLLADASDLADRVGAGTLQLAPACATLDARREEIERKKRVAERVAKYATAIQEGEMTLEEAEAKVEQEEKEEKERAKRDAEARSLWFDKIEGALTALAEWVETRTDDHLAWYTAPDAPGADQHELTAARIDTAIAQLGRVRDITLKTES